MTISIEISPHTQQRLQTMAAQRGQPLEDYVNYIIERGVKAEESIDVLLSPFRQGWSESGMSEEEITALLDKELKAVRAEAKAGRRSE